MKCSCGLYDLRTVSYGTVCGGCLNYPDRCLCNPKDLRRVLRMIGVLTVALVLALATPAAAACTTHFLSIGGRTIMCTTCCDTFGNCTTTCA